MTIWTFLLRMFNGNETARAMRYSITIILIVVVASYFGLLERPYVENIILTVTGYIFGKAKAHTEVIQTTERRDGKATTHTSDEPSS